MAIRRPKQFDIKLEEIGFKTAEQYGKSTERTILGRINKFIKPENILRGDVIYITGIAGYRNEGKYIWNGEKATPLDFTLSDYGSLPRVYEINTTNNFIPTSWLDLIDSSYVWFSYDIISKLKFEKSAKYDAKYPLESTISVKGKKWTFVSEMNLTELMMALATNHCTFSVINDNEIMVQYTDVIYVKPITKKAKAEKPDKPKAHEEKSAECLKLEREIEETRARLAQLEAAHAELCKK